LLEGIQILDFDWRYIYMNDAAARHGKTRKELQYCMKERVSKSIENEFLFEDKSKRWFELKIQPLPEGLFIISTDITARKESEAKIHKINHLYRS
jgi:PAS domain-containing protein